MSNTLDRRSFIATVAATAAAPTVLAQSTPPAAPAGAPAPAATDGPFTLPALPYAYEALEPSIDAETMHIHHDKHHAAYVNNLNAALKGINAPTDIDALIAKLDAMPADKRTAIKNNGGGHANHSLFWMVLAPKGQGGEPSKELVRAMESDVGGFAKAKEQLQATAQVRFGSGWAWLIVTPEKKLAVASTPNQESPLMGAQLSEKNSTVGTPIFGIDVWEHAYYLKYRNMRADYLKALWDIVNWNEVSKRYAKAMA
ncbi:MAG: superoxide dismutase [Phycisphaerales bacterium]